MMTNLPPSASGSVHIFPLLAAIVAVVVDISGRFYTSYYLIHRDDLGTVWVVILLILIWIIPYFWLICLLMEMILGIRHR